MLQGGHAGVEGTVYRGHPLLGCAMDGTGAGMHRCADLGQCGRSWNGSPADLYGASESDRTVRGVNMSLQQCEYTAGKLVIGLGSVDMMHQATRVP